MSLLEQNTTKKEQINKKVLEFNLDNGNSEKYKIEAIQNSAIFANKTENYLSDLYNLVA